VDGEPDGLARIGWHLLVCQPDADERCRDDDEEDDKDHCDEQPRRPGSFHRVVSHSVRSVSQSISLSSESPRLHVCRSSMGTPLASSCRRDFSIGAGSVARSARETLGSAWSERRFGSTIASYAAILTAGDTTGRAAGHVSARRAVPTTRPRLGSKEMGPGNPVRRRGFADGKLGTLRGSIMGRHP
jgi:hypothetical protein